MFYRHKIQQSAASNCFYHLFWLITKHSKMLTMINLITLVTSIVCFGLLIYCTSVSNSIHIIHRYDSASNINKLNKYLVPNSMDNFQCKQSTYKITFNICCFHQFSYKYLHFAGFHAETNPHLYPANDSTKTTTMIYKHNDTSHFGCYGLQIWQSADTFEFRIRPIFFKTGLYWTVMTFCRKQNMEKQCASWLPHTYRLFNTDDKVRFFKQLPCNNEPSADWILKSDMHKGAGIIFINDSNYFRRTYLTKQQQLQSNPNCMVGQTDDNHDTNKHGMQIVAQQFIANILTIHGCKFHIRSFFVLANYQNPYIVLYADSIVIKATKNYTLDTFQKENVITNRAISKHNIDSTNDWVWNMKQLCEYLEIDLNDIINKVQDIARILFLSAKNMTDKKADEHVQHYVLTALDLLLTDDFELKVMELNMHPASTFIPRTCITDMMETSWQCKMGKMIQEEMIDIEIELAIKQRMGTAIDALHSLRNLQLIIWE
eukprot:48195_1